MGPGEPASSSAQKFPAGGKIQLPSMFDRCAYCRAILNPCFYFCLACGTPYKSVEAVLPPISPPPLTEGEAIRLKAPSVMPLFWTYFVVVLGCGIFSFLFFREDRPDLAIFLSDGVLAATTCVFAVIYWRSLAAQLGCFGFNKPAALLALIALPPALCINWAYSSVLEGLGVRDRFDLEMLRRTGIGELTLVATFCLIPAVTEEIAFRGLVQHWLQTAIPAWRALVLASFLFAVLHFSVLSLPYLFGVGMLLGWTKWKTNSLFPSMLLHFLHNLAVIELL